MLKKAAILKMADLLKVDKAKIEAALADDKTEIDIEIPEDVTVFNKAELKLRDDNQYGNGKKAGSGMVIDELKKKHGIEAVGDDPDKFVENLTKKIKTDLNLTPDVQVAELTKTLETTKRALAKANENADHFKGQMETLQTDTKLLAMLPNNRAEVMTNDEYLSLVKSTIKIETRDGKQVALKNGEVVTDPKTAEPIAPQKVIEGYFTERKWIKDEAAGGGNGNGGGRGGGNSQHLGGKGKYSKASELKAELEAENLNINGEAYTKRVQAAMKDNPEMDMNS